ncbi:MAG: 50S ribosomal protein L22 [bacterium]
MSAMEITHKTKNLRIAPRKLRLVVDKIRHQNAEQAVGILGLVPNRGGELIQKSLKSAIQVAKDKNLDASTLVIQRAYADEGMTLKRLIGHSRGRMSRISKKYSHLSIVLSGTEQVRARRKPAKAAEPEVTTETAEQVSLTA